MDLTTCFQSNWSTKATMIVVLQRAACGAPGAGRRRDALGGRARGDEQGGATPRGESCSSLDALLLPPRTGAARGRDAPSPAGRPDSEPEDGLLPARPLRRHLDRRRRRRAYPTDRAAGGVATRAAYPTGTRPSAGLSSRKSSRFARKECRVILRLRRSSQLRPRLMPHRGLSSAFRRTVHRPRSG
jgi:hypothetical protein